MNRVKKYVVLVLSVLCVSLFVYKLHDFTMSEKKLIIRGICATNELTRKESYLPPEAFQNGKIDLPVPLLFQHNPDLVLGKVTKMVVLDEMVIFYAEVYQDGWRAPIAEDIKKGLLNSDSVGIIVLSMMGPFIMSLDLMEISVVTVPAVRAAKFEVIGEVGVDVD